MQEKKDPPCSIDQVIEKSWNILSPLRPIKNFFANNPLYGLEHLPIDRALLEAHALFEQQAIPSPMLAVNRETIKWCQTLLDRGQAPWQLFSKADHFYPTWRELIPFDKNVHRGNKNHKTHLRELPLSAKNTIEKTLLALKIPHQKRILFLTLLLTTLPGWAAYVQHEITSEGKSSLQADYLAIRITLVYLLWPNAKKLLDWYQKGLDQKKTSCDLLQKIEEKEAIYHSSILKKLKKTPLKKTPQTGVQLLFCMDTRSEIFRRTLEELGPYETFGCAGFFGLPIQIENPKTNTLDPRCPPFVKPQHTLQPQPLSFQKEQRTIDFTQWIEIAQESCDRVKNTFTTPFPFAEIGGMFSGIWMAMRVFFPKTAAWIKKKTIPPKRTDLAYHIQSIPLADQCSYAEVLFRSIGLTQDFAPLVILCGHGSCTQNNPYFSALDCAACGGNEGTENAHLLATICNDDKVRKNLKNKGIHIPPQTLFIGGKHTTTTDVVTLSPLNPTKQKHLPLYRNLQKDLLLATKVSNKRRATLLSQKMGGTRESKALTKESLSHHFKQSKRRSVDWSETRPEWGLANNGSLIIAPRSLTKEMDLQGRSFLYSYDYRKDPSGEQLVAILNGPVILAQWINNQYLFSTLNNTSYGNGSKITENFTGKIASMQGNASDLMHGLPIQSVFFNDQTAHHETIRLLVVIYSPSSLVERALRKTPKIEALLKNKWMKLACIDPEKMPKISHL